MASTFFVILGGSTKLSKCIANFHLASHDKLGAYENYLVIFENSRKSARSLLNIKHQEKRE